MVGREGRLTVGGSLRLRMRAKGTAEREECGWRPEVQRAGGPVGHGVTLVGLIRKPLVFRLGSWRWQD